MATHPEFELLQEQEITELNTRARLFRHRRTGAELLSLENDDENKSFGITFRTPPTDSTGLPHIMEHAVLCGSKKYPLKEPFVELLKGSLKTFLNAFTYPDKTCYPVASQNMQDFYNLVDVYLDAVFNPLIPPETLQQEGWHYELESLEAPLTYKGVVFNEMKGAYSSPDNVLYRYSKQSLFPDNTYGVDSGGDPQEIPNLTYEQFKTFHQTYYHPSNARIFIYGDDDPAARFDLLLPYLNQFDPIEVDSTVPLQPPFAQPKRFTYPYDAGEGEDEQPKYLLTVNWLLPEITDPETRLLTFLLSYILVGTPASPLRKALIDSGLGEDVTGGGLQSQLRQMTFSTGLKGVAAENVDAVETLIVDTLAKLADQGIDPEMIEAAVNTTEFRLRENNTGSFPRGLALMMGALTTWLYGGNPIDVLAFEAPLNAAKERIASHDMLFEAMISRYFLDNTHRTTVILEPDPDLRSREEKAERARLQSIQESLQSEDLQAIIAATEKLKRLQETPDPPEALATLPRLELNDLDKENKPIPIEVSTGRGSQLLYHDLFTNGIVYLELGFDLHSLPQRLLPYIGLFGTALLEMGTEREDFVKLSQRIGRKTGGIHATALTSAKYNASGSAAWFILRGKSTMDQTEDLLAILQDVLLLANLDNQERFRQLVLEEKAGEEAGLVPGGHSVVNTRLKAKFDEAGWLDEEMGGVNYLFFVRQLAQKVEQNWPSVLADLEEIRRCLLNRGSMFCNITLDQDNWSAFQPRLAGFLETLPATAVAPAHWTPQAGPRFEGLTIPAQVNYVGKGANLFELGYQLHGSILVITNYLRTSYLWEKIRVQGGAYGGFCLFNHLSGVYSYLSYRDPNLLATLENYDRTVEFLRHLELNQDELTKGIIGVIGQMDSYQLPDAKGYTSMVRYLTGVSDDYRQQMRDQVLSTTAADFKAFADVLEHFNRVGLVAVLGSQEAINQANAAKGGNWLTVTKVL